MVFPTIKIAVSFCNLNPYDGFEARDKIRNEIKEINMSVDNFYSMRNYTEILNQQIISLFEYHHLKDNFDIYNMSFFLDQMLLDCEFQGNRCTSKDFYLFHDYHYGNCFRFNGNDTHSQSYANHTFEPYDPKYSKSVGWRNGLRLELYSGDQVNQQQFNYRVGFRIIIHNQSIVPFPDEDGVDVPVGKQTNIAMTRTFTNRLSQPFSDCIDSMKLETIPPQNRPLLIVYQQIELDKLKQYQQDYCLHVCYQLYIIQKCNCTNLNLAFLDIDEFNALNGCVNANDLANMNRASEDFANSRAFDKCYSSCPIECNTITYNLKISSAGKN